MFLISTLFLFLGASEAPYGAFYWLDQQKVVSPEMRISLGYGLNMSNDYVENHSLFTQLEIFPTNYWSLGILGQLSSGNSSSIGKEIKNLEAIDIHTQIFALDGAVFAFTGIDLMRGAWNFFNGGTLRSRFSVAAGYGLLHQKELTTKENRNEGSYLWKTEAAFNIIDPIELYVAFLGHRAERYLSAGMQLSLSPKPKSKI